MGNIDEKYFLENFDLKEVNKLYTIYEKVTGNKVASCKSKPKLVHLMNKAIVKMKNS